MISIIIPVYNTQKYLRCCLDSIVAQTYKDFEVILIDDGSTDGSGKMCDEYAEKDDRFRVFHKQNAGVSSARNLGVEKATGEWIFFMDSDDIIYPYALDMMMKWSNDCDLVVGRLDINVMDSLRGDVAMRIPKYLIKKIVSPVDFIKKVASGKYALMMELFPKLFKTKIVRNNNLRFKVGVFYAEDQLFVADYLCCNEVRNVYVNNLKSVL